MQGVPFLDWAEIIPLLPDPDHTGVGMLNPFAHSPPYFLGGQL